MDQMHLTQIGRAAKVLEARAVLNGRALMRVVVDPEPGEEADAVGIGLAHGVGRAAAYRPYDRGHRKCSSAVAESGLLLGDKGRHPFLLVLGGEGRVKQAPLEA